MARSTPPSHPSHASDEALSSKPNLAPAAGSGLPIQPQPAAARAGRAPSQAMRSKAGDRAAQALAREAETLAGRKAKTDIEGQEEPRGLAGDASGPLDAQGASGASEAGGLTVGDVAMNGGVGAFEAAAPQLWAQAPVAAVASDAGQAGASAAPAAASWVWLLPFALAGAAASGRSTTPVSSASSSITRGIRVVDGPVQGATVYVDLDDDGVVDAGEPEVGITDRDGNVNVTLTAEQAGHGLLAKGGTDTETNRAFVGVLAAPKGSTVINPLTTLVAALMEGANGKSLEQAKAAVVTALGLTGVGDVTTYDTFAKAQTGTAADLANHLKAVQIANIIVMGSALAAPDSSASAQLSAASSVIDALAGQVALAANAQAAMTFDSATLVAVLEDAATRAGRPSLMEYPADEVAGVILAINSVVAASGALADAAKAQVLAQVTLTDQVKAVAASTTGTNALLALQDIEQLEALAAKVDLKSTDTLAPERPGLMLGAGVVDGATALEATQAGGVVTVRGEAGATLLVTFVDESDLLVSKMLTGTGSAQAVSLSAEELALLGDGGVSVRVVQTDAAGNVSQTMIDSFVIDRGVPSPPVVQMAEGISGAVSRVEATQDGGVVTVTGELGATIVVTFSRGDVSVGTSLTGTGTAQTVSLSRDEAALLGQGEVTVRVAQTDAAGNASSAAILRFNLDTSVPLAPTLALGAGVAGGATALEVTQSAGVVTVTGEVGASVAVTFTSEAGVSVGKMIPATGSAQAVVLSNDELALLGQGRVSVRAIQTDAAGNVSVADAGSFVIDTNAPLAPTLALGAGVSGGATLAEASASAGVVTVSAESGAQVTVTFANGASSVVKPLTGTGSAQAVTLTAAELDSLGDGTISVSARQSDAAGNAQAVGAAATAFELDTALPKIASSGMSVTRSSRTVELSFTEDLSALDLTEANFVVKTTMATANGSAQQPNTVIGATVSGKQVSLLLASDFLAGMVNVEYTAPVSGSSSVGLQDAAGNQVLGFSSGKLADGYIRGASIFIQVAQPYTLAEDMVIPVGTTMPNGTVSTEVSTTAAGSVIRAGGFFYTGIQSNGAGDFFLPSSLPKGAMVATGGVNVDTGVPNNVVLKAPEGATIINPLTTMVQAVMDKPGNASLSAEAASMTVAAGLGLPADLDMTAYDPIAAGEGGSGDATALAVQKAAAQVATLVSLAEGSTAVIDNLASQFAGAAESGITVNLNDSSTLNRVLAGVSVDAEKQASMADAMNTIATSESLSAITSAQAQVLDKIAPKAPTVTVTELTNDITPQLRMGLDISSTDGSAAVVGDTVIVLVDGAQVATRVLTAADIAQGFATMDLPTLTAGVHQIAARQIDAAGNASGLGDADSVLIDLSAPTATLMQASLNGAGSAQVQSSEAGRAYLVSDTLAAPGGQPATDLSEADIAALAADMRAMVTLASANVIAQISAANLADGSYRLVTVDAAGNVSVASSAAVTVDKQAPLAAVGITSVVDNVEPTQGELAKGAATNDNTLALGGIVVGSLASDERVEVYDGAQLLGRAAVNQNAGTWSFLTPALGNGQHSLSVRVVDAAGNLGAVSPVHDVNVTATVPAGAVAIASATAASTNDTTPVISGTVTGAFDAADQVVIYDGRTRLGVVNAAAQWSFTVPDSVALLPGDHAITAVLENAGGNQGAPSSAYAIAVDTTAPTLTILSDDNALNVGDSAALTFLFSEVPAFAGSGVPVSASDGASLTGWALKAGSGGRVYTATLNAPAGQVTGSIELTVAPWSDSAGNAGTTSVSPILSVDTAAPSAPTLATNFGGSINQAEKAAGATIEVTANQADVVRLSIGSSTVTLGSSNATYANGKWTYALTANDYAFIGRNQVKVSATATDAAGNASAASAELIISADTIAPLLTPISVAGVSAANNRINDTTPSVSVTAEVGSTLAVDWDGSGVFTTVSSGTGVDGSGVVQGSAASATVTLTAPAAVGSDGQSNTIAIRATDAAGNVSMRSASYLLDTTAVSGRSIVVSQDGSQLTLSLTEPVAVDDLTLDALSLNNGHTVGTAANGAAITAVGVPAGAVAARATTFVVKLGSDATMAFGDTLSVNRVKVVDGAGNVPAADLAFLVPEFDAVAPTVQIGTDKLTLKQGESALLSFTFSEAVKGFDRSDIVVAPAGVLGTLSAPKFNGDGTVTYNMAYRPPAGADGQVRVSVDAGKFTDLVGNASTQIGSLILNADTVAPTVAITANAATLKAGSQATLTFTFSEAPASAPSITPVMRTASGQVSETGALGALTPDANNPKVYTATYTPPADLAGGKIGFLIGGWSDAAGNTGLTGAAPLIEVDTLAPTVKLGVSSQLIKTQTPGLLGQVMVPMETLELTFSEIPAALPTITPSLAGVTLTPRPLLGGNGVPSNRVLYDISVPVGTQGELSFTVGTWTDRLGNAGTVGSQPAVTVDTKAPEVTAAITAVMAGNTAVEAGKSTTAQSFTVSGTLDGTLGTGERLSIFDGTVLLGDATVSAQAWTLVLAKPLPNGAHSLRVLAQDAAGNRAAASAAFAFTVNADVPTAEVTIVSARDDAGALRGPVAHNAFTDDTTPTLVGLVKGTLASTDRVAVYKDGLKLSGFATVVAGGGWTYEVAAGDGATSGTYTAAVISNEGSGLKGALSAPLTLRTDDQAPTLTITSSKANLKSGESALLTLTFSEPVTGFSKSDITGVPAESLGSLMGPTTHANGTVSYQIEYKPGTDLEASAALAVDAGSYTDMVGNAGGAGTRAVAVDTRAPNAPQINAIAGDGIINQSEARASQGLAVSGTATGASKVMLSLGGLVRDLSVTSGAWTYTLTADDLAQLGQRSGVLITARAVDAAGNVSAQMGSASVVIDTQAPVININGPIAGDGYVNDFKDEQALVINGTTVDVPNGSVINLTVGTLNGLRATVNNNNWSLSLSPEQIKSLTPGTVTVSASSSATDAAGNAAATVTRDFVYDRQAPAAAAISKINGAELNGERSSSDSTPELTITAAAGSRLVLESAGKPLPTTAYEVKPAGTSADSFIVSVKTALPDGLYRVTAVDAAGNVSAPASNGSDGLSIDTRAPAVVGVSLSSNGSFGPSVALPGHTVTLRFGLSEPVAAPVVTLLGQAVTPTQEGSIWTASAQVPQGAPAGVAAFSIMATDRAGNAMAAPLTQSNLGPDQQSVKVFAQAPEISAAARVKGVSDLSGPVITQGSPILIAVHFAAPVVVKADAALPQLALTLVNDAGQSVQVMASALLATTAEAGAAAPLVPQSSVQFVYRVQASDYGHYQIGAISDPAGAIREARVDERGVVSAGLPAALTLTGLPITAGSFVYGAPIVGATTGTASNDVIVAQANGTNLQQISGGDGNRDVVLVPLLLPEGSSVDPADLSLKADPANGRVLAIDAGGITRSSATLPSVFPAGVEHLVYRVFTQSATGPVPVEGLAPLMLSAGVLTYSSPLAPNDRFIFGAMGNDSIDVSKESAATRYVIRGGLGNDVLKGHDGQDTLIGEGGNDALLGEAGDDVLVASEWVSQFDGGSGNDTLSYEVRGHMPLVWPRLSGPAIGAYSSVDGQGRPTDAVLSWRLNVDDSGTLAFASFRNASGEASQAKSIENIELRLYGNERYVQPLIYGGASSDVLTASGQGISVLAGLAGNDVLNASNHGSDVLLGGGGNDQLNGGNAADLLYGGAGDDVINGRSGDDFMVGGAGNDRLDGGDGALDVAGFTVAGVGPAAGATAASADLYMAYDAGIGAVVIKQGSRALAKISKDASGQFVVGDMVGTSNTYTSFGTDTVGNAEKFLFDYPSNPTGVGLTVDASQISQLLAANVSAPPATGAVSLVTKIDWTDDDGGGLYRSGDEIAVRVHFTNPVVVAAGANGAVPFMYLTLVDDQQQTRVVQAQYLPWGGLPAGQAQSSLDFVYRTMDDDEGRFHLGRIELNGATITESLPGATAPGLPADLSLSPTTAPNTSASYIYGSFISSAQGTDANDAMVFYEALLRGNPAVNPVPSTGPFDGRIDGGAGSRDVLGVPLLLPESVDSDEEAAAYRLVYSEVRDSAGVVTARSVQAVDANGVAVTTAAVPMNEAGFPKNVESLAYYLVYRIAGQNQTILVNDVDAEGLLVHRAAVRLDNPVQPLDRTVLGSLFDDDINVSADTLSTTRYLIDGGPGRDKITGHVGVDDIDGGLGNDDMAAMGGNDTIYISRGADQLDGGEGMDTLAIEVEGVSASWEARLSSLRIVGQGYAPAGQTAPSHPGYRVSDTADGRVWVGFESDSSSATMMRSVETLQVQMMNSDSRWNISLLTGDAAANTLTGTGQSIVMGMGGNDTLIASARGDALFGGGGDDQINGGRARDVIYGGDGADRVAAGGGDDFIVGGPGNDVILGEDGIDRAGYFVNAAAGGGVLTVVDDTTVPGDRLIMQGSTRLARLHRQADGSLIVSDESGQSRLLTGYTSFGSDKLSGVEELIFDVVGGSSSSLTLKVSDLPVFTLQGTVIDGYVSGALVFYDADKDGTQDAGEASAVTDANGRFTLTFSDTGGQLIARAGGTDGFTGQVLSSDMIAPASAEVITPLTTLLGVRGASMQGLLVKALGLQAKLAAAGDLDLGAFDPVKAMQAVTGPELTTAQAGALRDAGAAVFTAQQVIMTVLQSAQEMAPELGVTGLAGKINAQLEQMATTALAETGFKQQLQSAATRLVSALANDIVAEKIGQALSGTIKAQAVATVAGQIAGPVNAVVGQIIVSLDALGPNLAQAMAERQQGLDTAGAKAATAAMATVRVAQSALLTQLGAIGDAAQLALSQAGAGAPDFSAGAKVAGDFTAGLPALIAKGGSEGPAAPALLPEGLVKVFAGQTEAYADGAVSGSHLLTGSERSVEVQSRAKVGVVLAPGEQAQLLKPVLTATNAADLRSALTAASAKLDISFVVLLGEQVNIDGVGGADAGARAFVTMAGVINDQAVFLPDTPRLNPALVQVQPGRALAQSAVTGEGSYEVKAGDAVGVFYGASTPGAYLSNSQLQSVAQLLGAASPTAFHESMKAVTAAGVRLGFVVSLPASADINGGGADPGSVALLEYIKPASGARSVTLVPMSEPVLPAREFLVINAGQQITAFSAGEGLSTGIKGTYTLTGTEKIWVFGEAKDAQTLLEPGEAQALLRGLFAATDKAAFLAAKQQAETKLSLSFGLNLGQVDIDGKAGPESQVFAGVSLMGEQGGQLVFGGAVVDLAPRLELKAVPGQYLDASDDKIEVLAIDQDNPGAAVSLTLVPLVNESSDIKAVLNSASNPTRFEFSLGAVKPEQGFILSVTSGMGQMQRVLIPGGSGSVEELVSMINSQAPASSQAPWPFTVVSSAGKLVIEAGSGAVAGAKLTREEIVFATNAMGEMITLPNSLVANGAIAQPALLAEAEIAGVADPVMGLGVLAAETVDADSTMDLSSRTIGLVPPAILGLLGPSEVAEGQTASQALIALGMPVPEGGVVLNWRVAAPTQLATGQKALAAADFAGGQWPQGSFTVTAGSTFHEWTLDVGAIGSDSSTEGPEYGQLQLGRLVGQQFVVLADWPLVVTDAKGPSPVGPTDATGVVVDGYVSGAMVFYDADNDGVKDADEPSALTNGLGQYALSYTQTASGRLVAAAGGLDTFSGQSLVSSMAAPSGSGVISPLTTLTAAGGAAAMSKLAKVFAIDALLAAANVSDLGRFDPVAAMQSGNAAQVNAGTAVFTLQQTMMSVMQVATTLGSAGYGSVAGKINAAIDDLHTTLGTATPNMLTSTNAIVDAVTQQLVTEKINASLAAQPLGTPDAVKTALQAQVPVMTGLIASPIKAMAAQTISGLGNLGPQWAKGLIDLQSGVTSAEADAVALAKATVAVAQDTMLKTIETIASKASAFTVTPFGGLVTFPEMATATSLSSGFGPGLGGAIQQARGQLMGDSPVLTQGFLSVQAGTAQAHASRNTAQTSGDVTGQVNLSGTEKVSLFASAKNGGTLTAAQQQSVAAIKSASNPDAFHQALKSALAAGVLVDFSVSLGNGVDINADGQNDPGASARLAYVLPTMNNGQVTATTLSFLPMGEPVLKQGFVKVMAGMAEALSGGASSALVSDDVRGQANLTGAEVVRVYGSAKTGLVLEPGEREGLMAAIFNANSSAAMESALSAAQAKLDLQFRVDLSARDINGDASVDSQVSAGLIYAGHSGGNISFLGQWPGLTQGFFKVAAGQTGAHALGADLMATTDDISNAGYTLQTTDGSRMGLWASPSDPRANGVLTLAQQKLVADMRLAATPSAFDAALKQAQAAGLNVGFKVMLDNTADINGGSADANAYAHVEYAGIDGTDLLIWGDSIALNHSYLTLATGATRADGIAAGQFVVGSYTVGAGDASRIGMQVFPTSDPNAALTPAQIDLVKAVIKAANLAAFDAAVADAEASGLDLNFDLLLGQTANIDGQGGNEVKAYAHLNYQPASVRGAGPVLGLYSPDSGGGAGGGTGNGPLASFNGATIDASGTTLTLTYAQTLGTPSGDIKPRFSVKVDGLETTVSAAVVSGDKVTLTLAPAAAVNATVTVRYTDPNEPADSTTGVLEYPGGADVPSIGDTPVVWLSQAGGGAVISLASNVLSQVEGNLAQGSDFVFTVKRDGSSAGAATVAWAVSAGSSDPANAADFFGAALPSGTLTFAAGEASKTIAVKVAGDTTVEPNETFRLTLSNPSGATLGTSVVAVATITNDDTGSNAGAPPELTQGFLKVSAGLTSAFSTNNTSANTDDKTGSYQLVGTEKITVMGWPKQELTIDSAEMATLLNALTAATDVAGFVAAVAAAQAKLDLKFAVALGDSVNIDGVAGGDAGAYANLIYQGSAASGTEIRFGAQDAAAPTLSQTAPLDDATGVAIGSDIVLTFNEPVQAGSGSIVISNGTDTRTIAVNDSQVTIAGSTVTINPTNDLQPGAAYSVQMASGVLKDMANNAFAGISNATTFNFGTAGGAMGSGPLAAVDGAVMGAAGTSVTLTFAQPLKAAGDLKSLFTVKVNSTPVSVTSAPVVGDQVTLNLASPAPANAMVTVSYTDPDGQTDQAGGVLEYAGGADVPSLGDTPVARAQPTAEPAPSSATVTGGSMVQEGQSVAYTVSVTTAPTSSKTLQWRVVSAVSNGAVAQDFGDGSASNLPTGGVTIAAGATSGTFSVSTFNDTLAESIEGYKVEVGYFDASAGGSFVKLGEASTSIAASDQGPAPVIDLGALGQLIAPVQVDGGKTYYHWDRNGNGNSQGDIFQAAPAAQSFPLSEVYGLFKQNASGSVGSATDESNRFAVINGVKLALPRLGVGVSPSQGLLLGTSVSDPQTVNAAYDDLAAIWDAYNGSRAGTYPGMTGASTNADGSGVPPAWDNGSYVSATPFSGSYAYIRIYDGLIEPHANWAMNVALQVLELTAATQRVNSGADLIVDGSGSSTPSLWVGGNGADQLTGGSANDVFMAGPGADQLTGGLGADRFVFKPGDGPGLSVNPAISLPSSFPLAEGVDWIKDFGVGDKMDLSGLQLDANLLDGLADSSFAVIRGTFDPGAKAFAVGNSSSPAALVIYDGNPAVGGVSVSAILLTSDQSLPTLTPDPNAPGVIMA